MFPNVNKYLILFCIQAERTVTMHGGQNIYGKNVVINIYQQDKV